MMKRFVTLFVVIPGLCLLSDVFPYTGPLSWLRNADVLFAFLTAAVALLRDEEAFGLTLTWGFALDALTGMPLHMIALVAFRYGFRLVAAWFYEPMSVIHVGTMALCLAMYRVGEQAAFVQGEALRMPEVWVLTGWNAGLDTVMFLFFLLVLRRMERRPRRVRR